MPGVRYPKHLTRPQLHLIYIHKYIHSKAHMQHLFKHDQAHLLNNRFKPPESPPTYP
jgi:hypothetical protein